MKKCLITGACGNVGMKLISKLLNTNQYEITVLDLKSSSAIKKLNKFKDKINIVYGDINDEVIMKALIKDHDIIFHLAGIMPPVSELHSNLINLVDYGGTKSIVDAINNLNPNAYLIYLSTTAIYGDVKEVKKESSINIYNNDFYSQNKYKAEDYIIKNLKNYTIYRTPLIIDKKNYKTILFNIPKERDIEVVSNSIVASALVKSLSHKQKLNKKIFILSGGKNYRTSSNDLYINMLKVYGLSNRYILSRYFVPQNFYGHYYEDNELNDILDYQKGTINDIYKTFSKQKKFSRCLNRLGAFLEIRKLSKSKK